MNARCILLAWASVTLSMLISPRSEGVEPTKDLETEASKPLADRLAALNPGDPEEYFKLAEEVSDKADDTGARRLATRLYVLAYELDRQRGGTPSLAASSCLGLIPVASAERDRQWLSSIARLLDARHASLRWIDQELPAEPESAFYKAATVLGSIRAGRGDSARQLMQDSQVTSVLERFDRTMVRLGVQGGAKGLEREAKEWPCKECGNERIVKRGNRGQDIRLCSNCKGSPGPDLKPGEFLSHLRMESLLLQGTQRSWAAQLSVDNGSPLIDPDPDAVAETFNVDATLVLYRDGHWVADPNAPTKPKKQTKPSTDGSDKHPKAATPRGTGNDPQSTAGN